MARVQSEYQVESIFIDRRVDIYEYVTGKKEVFLWKINA